MKNALSLVIVIVGLFLSLGINGQDENPVTWEFEISDKPNVIGMYEITFTATIAENWHMYSQNLPSPDEGPLPTVFTFDYKDNFNVVGEVAETTKPHSVFDDVFGVKVNYFDGKAVFKQLIGLVAGNKEAIINGTVSYMVCNESTCLPPNDVSFSLKIKQ